MAGPRYDVDIGEFIKKIPEFINGLKKRVARELLISIVNPEGKDPFKTGSYISSHRIGVGAPDDAVIILKKGAVTVEQAKASVLVRGLSKLSSAINVDDDLFISNSVPWAKRVEYSGWVGTSPYLVYEKAVQKIEPQIPKYVDQIEKSMGMD